MADHETPRGRNGARRARMPVEVRRERLAELVLVERQLQEGEVALLWEIFPDIFETHYSDVWCYLRRRGLEPATASDVSQDVFLHYYTQVCREGFLAGIGGTLHGIAKGKLLNVLRADRRDPVSVGLPSPISEPPRTPPDLDRAMDHRDLGPRLRAELSDKHWAVVELMLLLEATDEEAAATLNIPLGTVLSRLRAAKRLLPDILARLLPPSQRSA